MRVGWPGFDALDTHGPRITDDSTASTAEVAGSFDVPGEYMLFLVFWIATGVIALVGGVLVVVKAARQMERAAAQASRATKSKDALAA